MRILFCSLPAYGHLYPVMPLALALKTRGHEVIVATGLPFAGSLPLPSLVAIPAEVNFEWAGKETARRNPEVVGLAPADAWRFAVEMFADVIAGRVVNLMDPELATVIPDLVVYESTNVGAAVAADLAHIPAVAHGIGVWDFFQATLHTVAPDRLAAEWLDRGSGGAVRLRDEIASMLRSGRSQLHYALYHDSLWSLTHLWWCSTIPLSAFVISDHREWGWSPRRLPTRARDALKARSGGAGPQPGGYRLASSP